MPDDLLTLALLKLEAVLWFMNIAVSLLGMAVGLYGASVCFYSVWRDRYGQEKIRRAAER